MNAIDLLTRQHREVEDRFEEFEDAGDGAVKEQVEHHVEEEEGELFPQVRKVLSGEVLEDVGNEMQELADALESKGRPRDAVPGQTDAPPEI